MKKVYLPISDKDLNSLQVGECVYLYGTIYTARDAAHKRIVQAIEKGEQPPFTLKGQTIYYVGPCPSKPDSIIGSCGPTTAYRCDVYTPKMLDNGLKVMIGKGKRSDYVVDSIKKNCCIYLCAIGGAGALYAECVTSSQVVAYNELMSEAVYELKIKDFPVVVAIDSKGNNIFDRGSNGNN